MSFYDYKIRLNTDYNAAFDAFIKAGNAIGKIETSDANNGEIVFKSGMSLLKMRVPLKEVRSVQIKYLLNLKMY